MKDSLLVVAEFVHAKSDRDNNKKITAALIGIRLCVTFSNIRIWLQSFRQKREGQMLLMAGYFFLLLSFLCCVFYSISNRSDL